MRVVDLFWTVALPAAAVETFLYHAALGYVPRMLAKGAKRVSLFSAISFLLKESAWLRWFDVLVLFGLLYSLALGVVLSSSLREPSTSFYDLAWQIVFSIMLAHFTNRFLLKQRNIDLVSLVVPTLIGFLLPVSVHYLSIVVGWQPALFAAGWVIVFAFLLHYVFITKQYAPSDFLGLTKDAVSISVIFILATLLTKNLDRLLDEPKTAIVIASGISVIAVIVALVDLFSPYSKVGEDLALSILEFSDVPLPKDAQEQKRWVRAMRVVMYQHVLLRTGLLLFFGVVAPFVLYMLYRALAAL